MGLYPINLRLEGRVVLVVGGGEVAARKVEGLLEAGAQVRIVSPRLCEELEKLGASAEGQSLRLFKRRFDDSDIDGAALVFACTDDPDLNRRICELARAARALAQSVTDPDASDFHVPSRVRRGEFLATLSTGGASPALAAVLRKRIEKLFPVRFASYVELLARVRVQQLKAGRSQKENAEKFRALVDGEFEKAVLAERWEEAERILIDTLGPAFTLDALGWKKDR